MASLLIAWIVAFQADSAIALGPAERDLTGDGKPETLRVVGVGSTTDNLEVTFTIESAGRTIYQFRLERLTRLVGLDGGRRVISTEQHRARLNEFERWFFAEGKFQQPAEFVASLAKIAPGRVAQIPDVIARDRDISDVRDGRVIWQEIQESRLTVFTFSPGGDAIVAIGWSRQAGRFYRLVECC